MVAGVALFLLGPVYLTPHEWNTDVGITVTHMSNGFGMRVHHIEPSCSFWRCGLRQNDCVITANGSGTSDLEPLAALALLLGPHHGQPLTMHVLRGLPGDISALSTTESQFTFEQPTFPRAPPSSSTCSCTRAPRLHPALT